MLATNCCALKFSGGSFESFNDLQVTFCIKEALLKQRGLYVLVKYKCSGQIIKYTRDLELLYAFVKTEAIHIILVCLEAIGLEKNCKRF